MIPMTASQCRKRGTNEGNKLGIAMDVLPLVEAISSARRSSLNNGPRVGPFPSLPARTFLIRSAQVLFHIPLKTGNRFRHNLNPAESLQKRLIGFNTKTILRRFFKLPAPGCVLRQGICLSVWQRLGAALALSAR
jgi:hypothetical protein